MAYFGEGADVDYDPYIEYAATPPTARSGVSSGSNRFTPRTTPRTPRTPRTTERPPATGSQKRLNANVSRAKSTPHGPSPSKTPTIWKASTWVDEYNDPTLEDDEGEDDSLQQDFWTQLWMRAGYAPTGDGNYTRTHIPLRSSLPTQRDIQYLAEMEERRIEEEEEREETKPMWQNDGGAAKHFSRIAELTRFGELDKLKEMLGVLSRAGTLDRFINFQDAYGWTPMHWAAEFNPEKLSSAQTEKKLQIMRNLLEYKATMDLSVQSSRGNTALIHAIWNGNTRACLLLLKKDASDPNAVTESGWTPMHWAANGKHTADDHWAPLPDIVQLLLRRRHEVQLDATTNGGDTPLHLAVMRGFKKVIEMLLFAGAPVDKANLNGLTPLHLAALHDYPHLIRFLLQWSARHRTLDKRRRSPAHIYAASLVHRVCLMRFPNLDAEDEFDRMNLNRELAEWLTQHGLSDTLLSPSVEPDQVLLAFGDRKGLDALQSPPHPISAEQADSVLERLDTLRLLRDGLSSSERMASGDSVAADFDRSRSVFPASKLAQKPSPPFSFARAPTAF